MAGARDDISHLAGLDRLPCSPGEHEAAEWIAEQLRAVGLPTTIDEETIHGTYYWPLGLANAAAVFGGLLGLSGRRRGGLLAALGAAAIWQDLTGGTRRTLRGLLRRGTTTNVIAEIGPRDAPRTLVVHAHHDAARTSFIFDQTVPRLMVTRFPGVMARTDRWPPLMGLVIAGPAVAAIGALLQLRRATAIGTAGAAASAGVMAHMSRQPVVPGANDNLSGVAVLLAVARTLAAQPPPGLRVLLLSAGAEEANQEGMLAFGRRHFGSLDPERTSFLCLDTVGSPELVLIEGEGFLRMYEYDEHAKQLVANAAQDAGVHVRRGHRFTFATDALVPLRAGYPVSALGSINEYLVPSNYHWPTDTAANVEYDSVQDATHVVLAAIARLDAEGSGASH
jgi:hypothetical protein